MTRPRTPACAFLDSVIIVAGNDLGDSGLDGDFPGVILDDKAPVADVGRVLEELVLGVTGLECMRRGCEALSMVYSYFNGVMEYVLEIPNAIVFAFGSPSNISRMGWLTTATPVYMKLITYPKDSNESMMLDVQDNLRLHPWSCPRLTSSRKLTGSTRLQLTSRVLSR